MAEVQTARLLLRRWQEDDRERLVALHEDPLVAWFLSLDGRPWPRERTARVSDHFLRQWREYGFGPWAAIDRRTGRWLGEIGLNERPDWPGPHKVEVGWELHPSVWGQGLPPRAAWPRCGMGLRLSVWSGSSARPGPTTPRPGG
jgi:RimJ/RimL family protein N-acetyltransferase